MWLIAGGNRALGAVSLGTVRDDRLRDDPLGPTVAGRF